MEASGLDGWCRLAGLFSEQWELLLATICFVTPVLALERRLAYPFAQWWTVPQGTDWRCQPREEFQIPRGNFSEMVLNVCQVNEVRTSLSPAQLTC